MPRSQSSAMRLPSTKLPDQSDIAFDGRSLSGIPLPSRLSSCSNVCSLRIASPGDATAATFRKSQYFKALGTGARVV
jgi:hypothetical protein